MEHLVLLKFKADAIDSEAETAFCKRVVELLKIEGVTNVCAGRSFTHARARGYTHAVRVRMRSKEDLKTYATHPIHVQYKKECIVPLLDEKATDVVCAVDFESADAERTK